MFRVRERSMSDTPSEGRMNGDSLRGCAVSFVFGVGILGGNKEKTHIL